MTDGSEARYVGFRADSGISNFPGREASRFQSVVCSLIIVF